MAKAKGPTYKDVRYHADRLECRKIQWLTQVDSVKCECPFCGEYAVVGNPGLWLLNNGCKRCKCGARLESAGNAYRFKEHKHGETKP